MTQRRGKSHSTDDKLGISGDPLNVDYHTMAEDPSNAISM